MRVPRDLPLTVFLDDVEVHCRYDYDAGEAQWFDARAGVGSPGYPPSAWVTELLIDGKWVDVEDDRFTQEQRDAWDQRIVELLTDYEEEHGVQPEIDPRDFEREVYEDGPIYDASYADRAAASWWARRTGQ